MEAQLEYVHIAYTVLHVCAPTCMLSRGLLTKFLHRSSVGSLLRVRCWPAGKLLSIFQDVVLEDKEMRPISNTGCVCVGGCVRGGARNKIQFCPPPLPAKPQFPLGKYSPGNKKRA